MYDAYKLDGMPNMPILDDNCLSSIERSMAFDVRDWSEDSRSAWIYGIVLGWDDESYEELAPKFHWTEQNIERNKKYHQQWEMFRKQLDDRYDKP